MLDLPGPREVLMPVDLKNKPDKDSSTDPGWFRRTSDPLEDAYKAPAATNNELPEGHPSRSDSVDTLSGAALEAAEAGGGKSQPTESDEAESAEVGGLYSKRDAGKQGRIKKLASSKRNKWIAGGIGGAIVGTILTFMLLLPFKVIGILDNLKSTFGAAAEQATERQGERIMSAYIVNKVMPGMLADQACTSTRIDRSCAKVTPGDGPIAVLYNAWRDGNIEKRLADKGIVIERNGTRFKMITPSTLRDGGINLGDLDLNDIDSMDRRLLQEMSRKQVRSEFRKAYQDVTFAKRIMYRFKVDTFLQRKYEIKRCLIACNLRDDRADRRDNRRAAWKTIFAQRVIYPRSEINGLVIACALNDFDCTKDLGDPDEDGKRNFKLEDDVRNAVSKYVADGGNLEDLNKKIEDYKSGGLDKLLFANVIDNAFAKGTLKAVPYIGWIDLASTIFSSAQEIGPAAKKINYIVNSQTAVQTYMMYRTSADEIKAGDVDAEMLGSVTNSLGPDFGTDQGGKGAEASFYYQQIMGSSSTPSASASLFGAPKVHAAGNSIECDNTDDHSSPDDPLCPEERLDTVRALTSVAGSVSWLLGDSIFFLLPRIQDAAWDYTVGLVIDLLESALADIVGDITSYIIDHVPGAQEIVDYGAEIAKQVGEWMLKWFINSPVTENVSGSRNFNLAAVGANVAMNEYTHYGLGGKQVSNATMNQIRTAVERENHDDFKSQSLLARIADKESKYSLVSKAAMSLPSSTFTGTNQSLSATLLNPFGAVSNSLLSLGSTSANAATNKNIDDAGVTQYAWDLSDPVFSDDPEEYWEREGCDDEAKMEDWANNTVENPDTGMPEHDKAFGCKLLDTSVRISGAYFTDSLLTTEELGNTEDDTDVGDAATGNLRVASFNVLGSCHTSPGCGSYKPANARFDSGPVRMREQLKLWEKLKIDVVGVQEFEPPQREIVVTAGASKWDIFPETAQFDQQFSKQSIIWQRDKYDLVKGGGYLIPYGNGQLKVAWAILQIEGTDTKFRVISTHDPANARGNAAMRLAATRKHIEELNQFKNDGLPNYFVGDFNSNTNDHPNQEYPGGNNRNLSAYCLLTGAPTGTDYYRHAYDIVEKSRDIPCPTHKALGIDHVFVPKGTNVTQYKSINTPTSDHPVVFADIALGVEPVSRSARFCDPVPNLNTVNNFRDASLSTNVMKPGVLLRSGYLSELSNEDAQKLSRCLGQKGTIINFLPAGSQNSNDKPVPGVTNNRFSIDGSLNYAKFVNDPGRRRGFAQTIEFIAKSDGPVLIHCYSGKDRTGWTVAMIMYALGASNEEVLREYLLSNRAVSDDVTKQQLDVGLDAARQKYGSIDNYLTRGLGLSQATLDALNQRLGN
jgi:hypothetical protein